MIKKILIINIILTIIIAGYVFLQFPFIKLTTQNAVTAIERDFIRQDLNEEEAESFNFYKGWILGNQENTFGSFWRIKITAFILCLLFIINNFVILYLIRKKK